LTNIADKSLAFCCEYGIMTREMVIGEPKPVHLRVGFVSRACTLSSFGYSLPQATLAPRKLWAENKSKLWFSAHDFLGNTGCNLISSGCKREFSSHHSELKWKSIFILFFIRGV